jgi:magnesium chelatase family protein
MCAPPEKTEDLDASERVRSAVARQKERFAGLGFNWNSRIPAALIDSICELDLRGRKGLLESAETMGLSSRAFHSVLRIARTIADLAGEERIGEGHLMEAVLHRRYGDGDFFWARGRG